MKPVNHAQAIKAVMKAVHGTTFFRPGPHNVASLTDFNAPATKRKRTKKLQKA